MSSDDMPKVVRGDSGRIVQIFANLISNSIKFTTSGYIILRGWCENLNSFSNKGNFDLDQKVLWSASQKKMKRQGLHDKRSCKNENTMILFFEVEDTGCGIDPSKWESVFESFEQADPSTTRLHGGTGLGLCIVRTLVHKMGGEIRVVKKNGMGTLMQLYLLLSTPVDIPKDSNQLKFADHKLKVVLALSGRMSRTINSRWLFKYGVPIWQAREWNELTNIFHELFKPRSYVHSESESLNKEEVEMLILVIVIDVKMLNLSTDIWKKQLNYLDTFNSRAQFAWILNHDTSNTIKKELRRRGHLLMVNGPLYKAKMIQILETVIKESSLEQPRRFIKGNDANECVQIDIVQSGTKSSNISEISEIISIGSSHIEETNQEHITLYETVSNCFLEPTEVFSKRNKLSTNEMVQLTSYRNDESSCKEAEKAKNGEKSLEGLRILLAEDTPILQRVATIMLEQMGAKVVAVGDGVQAVEALNILHDVENRTSLEFKQYDLILMDCQMPKMDGYEATKIIRRAKMEIPIVALTAHAMSSDEAKCLEVGMDAYLTKPIDCKLMISTILSLTKCKKI